MAWNHGRRRAMTDGPRRRCGGRSTTRREGKSASECAFQAMLSESIGQEPTVDCNDFGGGEGCMAAVRLSDVAAAAGVSQATASRVLNGSSRVPGEGVADRG
ncbi:MAG: LacI family DNA-binding transcriptional regulator, partial [Verrucomicrobia bacterium]|nr:LacI family DNA-binding transcriptional regulator [Verrucomicrobiota bacterium]